MKLRNKETGEVMRLSMAGDMVWVGNYRYHYLADLYAKWEDVKEPLIKDEKVRKAVKAWADVNKIKKCECKEEMHCITFETERGMFISFEYADPITPEGHYTIAELCGDE